MTAAGGLFTATAMADLFSPRAHVPQMIRFEAALARSAARAGVIPEATASSIAGTPVILLVHMLAERVPESARGWVHCSATSQDVIDTALVVIAGAAHLSNVEQPDQFTTHVMHFLGSP